MNTFRFRWFGIIMVLLIVVAVPLTYYRLQIRTAPKVLTFMVLNKQFLDTPYPLNEFTAAAKLYRGDYLAAKADLGPMVFSRRGLVLLSRAQLALDEYPSALNYSSLDSHLWRGIKALHLAKLGYLKAAADLLSNSLALLPEDQNSFELALGVVLARQNSGEQAKDILNRISPTPLGLPQWQLAQGDLALRQGDYENAWELYNLSRLQGYLKDDPVAAVKLGLAGIGAAKDIQSLSAEIRSMDPQGGLADYLEAQAAFQRGDLHGAGNSLANALGKRLPAWLEPSVKVLAGEVEQRLRSEPEIQRVIKEGYNMWAH